MAALITRVITSEIPIRVKDIYITFYILIEKIQLNIGMGPEEYVESFYNPLFNREDFRPVFDYFDGWRTLI